MGNITGKFTRSRPVTSDGSKYDVAYNGEIKTLTVGSEITVDENFVTLVATTHLEDVTHDPYLKWETGKLITYDGNTNTGGTVPTDAVNHYENDAVTLKTNSGTLAKTSYTFSGWNTLANGTGTNYAVSTVIKMPSAALTLYARWILT
jgi:uncharacterized repeat protein (TIGR02543 family)